ncbi:MAG: MmcQ/YjbR family DNA-binding protein [Acidobacteriota bacterium]
MKPHWPDAFADVRRVGLSLPDVTEETKYDGTPVLKAAGSFMAGIATDEDADANSLVVRCDFEDRELMLEDAPDVYYVTEYHERYPVVLARLEHLNEDALRDLLSVSRRLAMLKARRKAKP